MIRVRPTELCPGKLDHDLTRESSSNAPDCVKNTKSYFLEFCDNTSIHGLKFLGEKKRSLIEKIWWFVVIVVSLCCGVFLIVKTYQKWISSPVIVSFATSQTSIRDIPFPAITICSDIKAHRNIFNYTDVELRKNANGNVTEEEVKNYNSMNLICDKGSKINDERIRFTDQSAVDFLTTVTPRVQETIAQIRWRGNIYDDATQFFTPVMNSEGICYTFNILDRKDVFSDAAVHYKNFFSNGNSSNWTIEHGYKQNHDKNYPRYSVVSGVDGGVDFDLYTLKDNVDYRCSGDYIGFRVSLTHPLLVPKGKKQFFSVPLNQIVLATVKPIMMKTSPELRSYTPEKRQCYFTNEKELKFFNSYNQPNCLLECLRNYTFEKCGCVSFYMPRDHSNPICGSGSRKCAESAKVLYLLPGTDNRTKSFSELCHCLPTCTSLDFEVEVSQSAWDWYKIYHTDSNFSERITYSRLRVFFKDMQFITSVRNELYGTTDFLANCGGLLGLFMGFSAISLFEILYFLSLRYICNVRKYGLNHWSGTELAEVKIDA